MDVDDGAVGPGELEEQVFAVRSDVFDGPAVEQAAPSAKRPWGLEAPTYMAAEAPGEGRGEPVDRVALGQSLPRAPADDRPLSAITQRDDDLPSARADGSGSLPGSVQ